MAEPLKTYSDRHLQSTWPVEASRSSRTLPRVARGDLVQNLTLDPSRQRDSRYTISSVLFNLRPFWSDCKAKSVDTIEPKVQATTINLRARVMGGTVTSTAWMVAIRFSPSDP
jgi:hypothetical protein